jgi:catechol 2,3-dioxygenase-like lactoylglutathione lyase family enzyme
MTDVPSDRQLPNPRVVQVALNTADMAGSLRLYAEGLGFTSGGADALWGSMMGIMELDESARSLMWWMLGRQRYLQLELFSISRPVQQRLPTDWRASDHGWVRFGVAVSDFDHTLKVLDQEAIPTFTDPVVRNGARRVAFRDPYAAVVVEVFEDGDAVPGGRREHDLPADPAIIYVTSSVADLESARAFYERTLEMVVHPLEMLHEPQDEALWGLPDAERNGFVVASEGGVLLEVVAYSDPLGRPRPASHRLCDQGLAHVCFGAPTKAEALAVIDRFRSAGLEPTMLAGSDNTVATYFTAPGREFEILGAPPELLPRIGFEPTHPFIPQEYGPDHG